MIKIQGERVGNIKILSEKYPSIIHQTPDIIIKYLQYEMQDYYKIYVSGYLVPLRRGERVILITINAYACRSMDITSLISLTPFGVLGRGFCPLGSIGPR